MNKVRGYLTRRTNGLYLVTAFRPVLCEVIGTDHMEAYFKYGDPMAFINITPQFIVSVGVDDLLDRLVPYKAAFYGDVVGATHILQVNQYGLYSLRAIYQHNVSIDQVCPWFVKKMFNIIELHRPMGVHFTGEIYGSA